MSDEVSKSNPTVSDDDLLLLAGYVLGDLTDHEMQRTESLIQRSQSAADVLFELERTATGVQLALNRHEHVLPSAVARRIREEGVRIVSLDSRQIVHREASKSPSIASVSYDDSNQQPVVIAKSISLRESIAWLLAAAAALMVVLSWRGGQDPPSLSTVEARSELLQLESLITAQWSAGKTPFAEEVVGDVVWHPETQQGYLRFVNLPVNDPTTEQYQLWIIDPQRDDEPIDGGVFDITSTGESVIEIDAKLKVIDPAAFAITIEKPGGVVVSTQERLPLLAKVESSQG